MDSRERKKKEVDEMNLDSIQARLGGKDYTFYRYEIYVAQFMKKHVTERKVFFGLFTLKDVTWEPIQVSVQAWTDDPRPGYVTGISDYAWTIEFPDKRVFVKAMADRMSYTWGNKVKLKGVEISELLTPDGIYVVPDHGRFMNSMGLVSMSRMIDTMNMSIFGRTEFGDPVHDDSSGTGSIFD
jgi:hypothetical protein